METKLNGLSPANAVSRKTKTTSKEIMKEFKPLDTYGDWVNVPFLIAQNEPTELVRAEVTAVLHEQIDAVIPNYWAYRKCVQFKESQRIDTLERQIAWLYRPNLRIIEAELEKIIRKLNRVLDPVVCKVECLDRSWGYNVRINIGAPGERVIAWTFTTKERAQAWIDRKGGITDEN